jgi:hypothetical protein
VRFPVNEYVALGELPNGISPRVEVLVTALVHAGIRAEAVPHIQTVEWSKFALFLSWMAPAVLTRLVTYKFQRHPDTAVVVALLVRETGLLAERLGIALEDREPLPIRALCHRPLDEAVAMIREFGTVMGTRAPAHKVSGYSLLDEFRVTLEPHEAPELFDRFLGIIGAEPWGSLRARPRCRFRNRLTVVHGRSTASGGQI